MNGTHRISIEVDDHCYEGLAAEAERLGVDVDEIASRAVAAWLVEIAENALEAEKPPAPVAIG